jgi:hypothetical protein
MTKRASVVTTILAALVALVLAVSVPALAAPPAEHGKKTDATKTQKHGKGSKEESKHESAESPEWTEDNDTNDSDTPNNVADEGDNRHPSGKDRSVENGGSGNQGNSTSAPDEDGHGPERDFGGTDKPNGPGGMDLADQDGNNGCGNDDDFEDDNEGWCGQKPKKVKEEVAPADEAVCTDDETMPAGEEATCGEDVAETCPAEDVMGTGDETCGDTADAPEGEVVLPATETTENESLAPVDEEVLGLVIERGPDAAVAAADEATGERAALPFTGGDVLPLLIVGLALLATGVIALNLRRGER